MMVLCKCWNDWCFTASRAYIYSHSVITSGADSIFYHISSSSKSWGKYWLWKASVMCSPFIQSDTVVKWSPQRNTSTLWIQYHSGGLVRNQTDSMQSCTVRLLIYSNSIVSMILMLMLSTLENVNSSQWHKQCRLTQRTDSVCLFLLQYIKCPCESSIKPSVFAEHLLNNNEQYWKVVTVTFHLKQFFFEIFKIFQSVWFWLI